MEPDFLIEWCTEWLSLIEEFNGYFTFDKNCLEEYIERILPKRCIRQRPPARTIDLLYSLEIEINCESRHDWDADGYRVELRLEAKDRPSQVHCCDFKLGKRLVFELIESNPKVTLVLRRKWRLHELTKAPTELLRKLLPQRASKAVATKDEDKVIFEGYLSDLSNHFESAQQAETIIEDEKGHCTLILTTLRLARKPSPRTLNVHKAMAKYLATFRKSPPGYPLMDSEGAMLLKMHAHRHRIPRTKRASAYLEVAIHAKRNGFHVPFAYLRQNLRALDNEQISMDTNEGLMILSKATLLDGLKEWSCPDDEEAISCAVCYFEAARRTASGVSIAKTLVNEVGAKMRTIFDSSTQEPVQKLNSNLTSLTCWIEIMDKICPKYGEERFSLLLENPLRDLVLPHAKVVVQDTLKEFTICPTIVVDIAQVLGPLSKLCQLVPTTEDFKAWFTDDQACDLVRAFIGSGKLILLNAISTLNGSHQDFAEKLGENVKQCERLVDVFVWRHVQLIEIFCREICDTLHSLRARLWSIQRTSSLKDHCVRINALREIDFACDEVRAFLRLGPTGLNATHEVSLRDVQVKVASSQNALILQLAAQMLNSKDGDQQIHEMVENLREVSDLVFEVNPHDRQKLVACLWKIFLVTIMKRQESDKDGNGDTVLIHSSVTTEVGEFVEKLLEICPHLRPDDLEVQ